MHERAPALTYVKNGTGGKEFCQPGNESGTLHFPALTNKEFFSLSKAMVFTNPFSGTGKVAKSIYTGHPHSGS